MSGSRQDDLGRFSDPSILVLISLAEGPKHGYAIMEVVEAFSGVRLGPGTLYGVLPRLERLGLIVPLESDDRRRPYQLTASGGTVLQARLSELKGLAEKGLARVVTP